MQILHGFFIDEPQDIVYDRIRILIEAGGLNMLLPHEKNDIAVVGFAISAVSIPLVALGVLCLFGVICNPVIGSSMLSLSLGALVQLILTVVR